MAERILSRARFSPRKAQVVSIAKAAAQLMGPIRKPALPMNGTQPRPIISGGGAA
jgi:hypothetical protein